jgi:heme-degrading monooxygenase HmoA
MIVTVFRSRLKSDGQDEYSEFAARMNELAQAMPGYVSHKIFTAADGERVTIVEFDSKEHLQAWSGHPEHAKAKKRGREAFYSEYRIQVCEVLRESAFRAD